MRVSPKHFKRQPSPSKATLAKLPSSIRYLLQSNEKHKEGNRSQEEIQLINNLLRECTIFQDLKINREESGILRELCNGVVLIFCQSPHIMEIKDGEIYIFLEGQGFQYLQNNYQHQQIAKYKIYENNAYIMVRKICTNEYFLSLHDNGGRYHSAHKKYQLMVDENTLLAKVSDELFNKIFMPKILERQKQLTSFIRQLPIFTGLPNLFFEELSKFVVEGEAKADEKMIVRGEKSKFVYFIRSGQVQMRWFNDSKNKTATGQGPHYYIANSSKIQSVQKFKQLDTFGMDHLDTLQTLMDKEVVCLSDCQFYKIQKRLLAIMVTSFDMQLQQKGKIWSQVNINNQIKGQNYCTPEQKLLLKNAQRIRTSERKARDLKLKFYASKKATIERQASQKQSVQGSRKESEEEKYEAILNHHTISPDDKRKLVKTSDGRFRTASVSVMFNTLRGAADENKQIFRKYWESGKHIPPGSQRGVNNFELISMEGEERKPSPLLRSSNAFEYAQKLQRAKQTRSSDQRERQRSSNKFVPTIQAKVSNSKDAQRYNSDLIGFFLDKKIKNEIVKKAEKVLTLNKNSKLIENRNLKRLFTARDCKVINALSQHDKKTIASDIVDRMSNLKDNPLLLQIQNQRRKLQRQMKMMQHRPKIVQDQPRKYKEEDECILIKNVH